MSHVGRTRPLGRFAAAGALGAGAAVLFGFARSFLRYGFDAAATLVVFAVATATVLTLDRLVRHGALPRWLRRLITRVCVLGLAVAVVLAAAGGVLLAATPGVGDAEALVRAQAAVHAVSDPDASTPPKVAAALVATEDARFWHNPGIDPVGVLRALVFWADGRGGDGGGATIEQQLAKMLYTDGQRTRRDQLEQVALAVKLAHACPKSEILRMYLSTAYFGQGYFGLDAAAHGYFKKSPAQLDWPQAALLVGLVQAPSAYDPLHHPGLARQRRAEVLGRLEAVGDLTPRQVKAFDAAPLGV
ncbi:biosynthetic peptidoglycan transglycosylase [Streptomyces sp. NL15-2K]|uniref:biosynthetic peptidoglycan transglycosylase n=1 Tax=Streptomyces sp. NL15-2K TaxID=376149 RepID=UPI000F56FD00|nr:MULTISPECIES: biosynthetic peptidoglycan transglycosylase [Actinomycetes]WKX07143.1 biosynthetic peptidoglycan transglycosylase [Kutzneria buriramensis]